MTDNPTGSLDKRKDLSAMLTCTPFRLRFNNYKACSRKFNLGASVPPGVPQVEFFRHFTEEGHHGFLKDNSVKIIDRLTGGNRMRESFWQYWLDCFAPKGLNTRQVDTQISTDISSGSCETDSHRLQQFLTLRFL